MIIVPPITFLSTVFVCGVGSIVGVGNWVANALLGGCFSRHDDAGESFELDNEMCTMTLTDVKYDSRFCL